jgi:hypothetical protein
MWTHMFALNLPVAEKILRPVIVYAFLVIMLRIFGKRELAQLNPFDLVVLLSVSNTVQNAIIGDDNSVSGGLIGAFALFRVNYLVVRFLFKHRRLEASRRPLSAPHLLPTRRRSPRSSTRPKRPALPRGSHPPPAIALPGERMPRRPHLP